MKNIFQSTLMLIFTVVLMQLFFACKSDELPAAIDTVDCDVVPANYNDSVKAILDSKCSFNGCHADNQSPIMTNYSEALNSSQRIIVRALDVQTMPPAGLPQLTEREKSILRCWSNKGFPEN
jgi:uncharacterized membrane protein